MAASGGGGDDAGSASADVSGSSAEAGSASCHTSRSSWRRAVTELPVDQHEAFGDEPHMRGGGLGGARRDRDDRRPQPLTQRRGIDPADAVLLQQFGERRLANAQRRGQHPRIPSVVLRPRWREAVAEAVELLRIDRVARQASFHQALDHQPARCLDRHADLIRRTRRKGHNPVRHLREPLAAMLERPLAEQLPGNVDYARPGASAIPSRHPRTMPAPQRTSCLPYLTGAPTMPAGPCTGALRRKLPTGHPSLAERRGASPFQVLETQGPLGGSRRPARLREITRAKSFRKVQGPL